ncbi:pseudouridine synthase [Aureococcus anophagefferens]|nr:pseudouridine synthase [Aureococcus anophagefferens]
MVAEYWRGVRFVAEYYHRCASWSWYYPWHYAPLAADMAKCVLKSPEGLKLAYSKLVRDRPIQPLQQLMAAAAAAHCCPKAAAELMTSELVFELQYLGDAFAGWQPQPNERSVHDVFAAALSNAGIIDCGAVAAGRTDRGVNAAHQVVSVRSDADRGDEDLGGAARRVRGAAGDARPKLPPGAGELPRDHLGAVEALRLLSGLLRGRGAVLLAAPPASTPVRPLRAALLVGERDFRAFCAPGGRNQRRPERVDAWE